MCREKPVARAGSDTRTTLTTDQSLLELTIMRALALVRHGRTRSLITAEQAAHHELVRVTVPVRSNYKQKKQFCVGHNHVDHVMLIESESDRPSAVHHNREQL